MSNGRSYLDLFIHVGFVGFSYYLWVENNVESRK